MNRNTILVGIAVIGIVITGVLISANSIKGVGMPNLFGISNDALAKKVVDYINTSGLSSTPATLVSVSEASGLAKIKIKIGTSEFDSYATKDGKLMFPQAFDMSAKAGADATKASASAPAKTLEEASAAVKKTDNPMLQAFVVARCPFGLQMQRAMAEAVKEQPSLAQYMKAVYIGSVSADGKSITSMHGDAEAKENLRQICIREEQPTKYWNYVACQMKGSGQEDSCATSTGVDVGKMNSCVADAGRGVAYAKKDFDLNTKYNVSGSPTLVLNDAVVDEGPFGGRSSDGVKTMICSGFNNKASFCSAKLNTTEAAASFSATYASSDASAASTGGAGCAPAQ
ncbi:MAG: hypothetical protein NTV36_02905 [Candidatus Staskawiczbacteria bacterium]|nr:hypothetical protein [Candidatus Staskawiczbacteria bacterium]